MHDVDTDIAHMVRIVEGFLAAGHPDKAEKYADIAVELMDSRRRYCRAAYWGVDADAYQAEIERLAADTVDDDAATESAVARAEAVEYKPIEVHIVREVLEDDEREEGEPAPPPVDADAPGEGWGGDAGASALEVTPTPVEITDAEANTPLEITPSELREDAKRAASPWHWGHLRKSEPEDA